MAFTVQTHTIVLSSTLLVRLSDLSLPGASFSKHGTVFLRGDLDYAGQPKRIVEATLRRWLCNVEVRRGGGYARCLTEWNMGAWRAPSPWYSRLGLLGDDILPICDFVEGVFKHPQAFHPPFAKKLSSCQMVDLRLRHDKSGVRGHAPGNDSGARD